MLLALVALLAFAAGWLAGWISASEYHWRFARRSPKHDHRPPEWPSAQPEWPPVHGRRDEHGS